MTHAQYIEKVEAMQEELVAATAERLKARALEMIEKVDWLEVAREEYADSSPRTLELDDLPNLDSVVANALENLANE